MPALQPGLFQGKATRAQKNHSGLCPGWTGLKTPRQWERKKVGLAGLGLMPALSCTNSCTFSSWKHVLFNYIKMSDLILPPLWKSGCCK